MKERNKGLVVTSSHTPTSDTKFTKYIKEIQKSTINPTTKRRWTTQDLAKALGFEYDRFRKIVNESKPTKKRDVIIVICIVLQMSVRDTNQALNLYANMPALDSKIIRDDVFLQILSNKQTEAFEPDASGTVDYIGSINKLLLSHGCNALDLHKQAIARNAIAKNEEKYTPINHSISTYSDELFCGPEYASLSAMYQPNMYRCEASLLLECTENKHRSILTVSLSTDEYTYRIERNADGRSVKYNTHSDEQELIPYFKSVHLAAKEELNKLLRILDDSRNYRIRKGARYKDGAIHIYVESFNYRIPELNEYCLLEATQDKTMLYVFGHSEFMYHHLGPIEYKRVFGEREHIPIEVFTSPEELSEKSSAKPSEKDRIRYSVWKSIFDELLPESKELREDIKSQRVHIRCIAELIDSGISVCEQYGVTQQYDCICCSDGTVNPQKESASFKFGDLPSIELTIADLEQAYQLGLPDIEAICYVKYHAGDISSIV